MKFFKVPDQIFEFASQKKLSGKEFQLLLYIFWKSDNDLESCWASNKRIAEELNFDIRVVARLITNLEKKGVISIKKLSHGDPDKPKRGKRITCFLYSESRTKTYYAYRLIQCPFLQNELIFKCEDNSGDLDNDKNEGSVKSGDNDKNGGSVKSGGSDKNEGTRSDKNEGTRSDKNEGQLRLRSTKTNITNTNNLSDSLTEPDKPVPDKVDERLRDEARNRAKQHEAGNVEAYSARILENWIKQGITSLNELRKAEEKLANTNSNRSNSRGRKPITEKLPEWAQQELKKSKKVQSKKPKNVDRTATVDQDISRLMDKIERKTPKSDDNDFEKN